MEDTWLWRDLPVLDKVVQLLEEAPGEMLLGQKVVDRSEMDPEDVARAIWALNRDYIVLGRQLFEEGGIDGQCIDGVTAEARRAVGQWPTPESLAAKLAEAFAEAADHEEDPRQKSKLREVAGVFGDTGREVVTEVLARVILRQTGIG